MPKTPTTPKSKTKGTGKDVLGSGSPAKQPRSNKKKEPVQVQVQDMAQWRASRIRDDATVSKGNAKKNYRLSDGDLEGLSRENSSTVVKIAGTDSVVRMYLYNEREVEVKAWEKHGGPEGFENILVRKRALWDKQCAEKPKKAKTDFPLPDTYRPGHGQAGVFLVGPAPKHRPDVETSTPALVRMKQEMEGAGAVWLWDMINAAFVRLTEFGGRISGRMREEVVTRARAILNNYPRRPTGAPPETPAFYGLQAVLERAPVDVGEEKTDGLEVDCDGLEGVRIVNWKPAYLDDVYKALIRVIEEHGGEGWCRARWLVYDKYLECNIGYIDYDDDDCEWKDTAQFWLDARDRRLHPNLRKPSTLRKRYHELLANVSSRQ